MLFVGHPKVIRYTNFEHFWINILFLSYAADISVNLNPNPNLDL